MTSPTTPRRRTRYACDACSTVHPAPHLGDCRSCSWHVDLISTVLGSFAVDDGTIEVVQHVARTSGAVADRYTVEKPVLDPFGEPTAEILSTTVETYSPALFDTADEAMIFALASAGWTLDTVGGAR